MDFNTAVSSAFNGNPIRLKSWEPGCYWYVNQSGELCACAHIDGKTIFADALVTKDNFESDEWEICTGKFRHNYNIDIERKRHGDSINKALKYSMQKSKC